MSITEVVKDFEKLALAEIENYQPKYSKEFDRTDTPLLLDFIKSKNELLKNLIVKLEEIVNNCKDDISPEILTMYLSQSIGKVLKEYDNNYEPKSDV